MAMMAPRAPSSPNVKTTAMTTDGSRHRPHCRRRRISGDRMKARREAMTSGSRIGLPTYKKAMMRVEVNSPNANELRRRGSIRPDLISGLLTRSSIPSHAHGRSGTAALHGTGRALRNASAAPWVRARLGRGQPSSPSLLLWQRGLGPLSEPGSFLDDGDGAGPTGRGGFDFDREAGNQEAVRRQQLEVVQFLDVTVADFAARLVAFPDQFGVLALGEFLSRVHEGGVPRPSVGARDLDAARGQVERCLATHAAAARYIIGLTVASSCRGVDDDDIEWAQLMANARKFGFDIGGGGNITVAEVAEVEFHARLEAPFQRHLIDGDGAFAVVHGGGEVPGRVEVRAIVGGDVDSFHRPTLAVRQVGWAETWKEAANLRCTLPMIEVGNLRLGTRRVGGDIALQGHRNVDDASGHRFLLKIDCRGMFVRRRVFVDEIMAGEAGNTGPAAEPRSDGSIRKTDANSRPCAGGTAGKRPARALGAQWRKSRSGHHRRFCPSRMALAWGLFGTACVAEPVAWGCRLRLLRCR